MDPFEGFMTDPQSLHKYLYAHANPVMFVDPSGEAGISLGSLQALTINVMLRLSVAVPAFGSAAAAVSRINIASVMMFFQRVQVSSLAASQRLPQILAQAQRIYPNLTRFHQHHVIPNYIAKALVRNGLHLPKHLQQVTVRVPHYYHQYLHNHLYKVFPKNDPLKNYKTVQDALNALQRFYNDFPLS